MNATISQITKNRYAVETDTGIWRGYNSLRGAKIAAKAMLRFQESMGNDGIAEISLLTYADGKLTEKTKLVRIYSDGGLEIYNEL